MGAWCPLEVVTKLAKLTLEVVMSENFRELPRSLQPLLRKFYRTQGSHMRIPAGARCWVAGAEDINAGVCMLQVTGGHWLTGLLVAPTKRNQGLAGRLIAHARAQTAGPIWLFCDRQLVDFYRRLGFQSAATLPESLTDRLTRYNRTKNLIAMQHENRTLACRPTP